jgi:hypothetical protein
MPAAPADRDAKELRALIDRIQKEGVRTRAGVIPIAIAFPDIGPRISLVAELTPETQSPSVVLQYRRIGNQPSEKGGR